MKRTSIQDIADRLGVSKGTVSLVLSGKEEGSRISDVTSRKVKAMAKKLNYQPNEIARSLSTGMTMSIGVVVTDISNDFFGNLTFYIQEQAKKYKYSVITTNTNENLEDFENAITTLLNRQIDGIILVPVDGGQPVAKKILERHVPLVQIDRFYPEINATYIVVDNYNATSEATEHLIRQGCRRMAVLCYNIHLGALLERRQGCIDVLNQYGLLDTTLIKDIDYRNQEEDIRQAIVDLRNHAKKVDVIFFCSRRVFVTGIKYMYKVGIQIPDEMQVVCFDKIDTFSIANIPINYIEQPIQEMGEKAVDILIEQMNGSKNVRQCVFKTQFGVTNQSIN